MISTALVIASQQGCSSSQPTAPSVSALTQADDEWAAYGRTPAGSRDSPLTQINRDNVGKLQMAWTIHTGDVSDGKTYPLKSTFEATPIYLFDTLYVETPFDRVLALDPDTGTQKWAYDPKIDKTVKYMEGFAARGVSAWEDTSAPADQTCRRRIFYGTIDARLIAIDAMTGAPCADFGQGGTIDLTQGVGNVDPGQYGVTSPPAIVGDLVIVGSAIGDNRGVDLEKGTVRAFDIRTGQLRWSWDPIARNPNDPGYPDWDAASAARTRSANVWSVMSADPEHDLLILPTSSPAPDYYGGERLGKNSHANSVVALRASTGDLVWSFQVVHHDLWDYDIPDQPVLTNVNHDGKSIPAVVISTKFGHVFVLDRQTGLPILPVEERPVPASDVPGEQAWPTQPFPVATPNLVGNTTLGADDAFGVNANDLAACKARLSSVRSQGVFTPVSTTEVLEFPSALGGTNWGGMAVDEKRGVMVTAVNRFAMTAQLIPREQFDGSDPKWKTPDIYDIGQEEGTPYVIVRRILVSPLGLPCNKPPWGNFTAVDLATGAIKWQKPLGVMSQVASVPGASAWGSPSLGGPIVTDAGLAFIGGSMDNAIRAFDTDDGTELWRGDLPAGGQATPMTYRSTKSGRQFVVIAAGGNGRLGSQLGDTVVAFALPQ